MPESIFKQVSLDILRLHQHTVHSLLATQCCGNCEVHEAAYVTIDGRYYVWQPCSASADIPETGILLIEDEDCNARLSWVAKTREICRKDNLYERASLLLQRKIRRTCNKTCQSSRARLLELTPEQGRLTTGSKDLSLSPGDLVKALYPATYQLGEFAM